MIAGAASDAASRFGGTVDHLTVAGGQLEVETLGTGPAIIFVHGWTLDRRMWRPQAAALRTRFRIVAFDRRGFGRSTAPADPSLEPDDIIGIADAFGLDRFAVAGMSQGCRAAARLAADAPERVTALVLQGAPHPDAGPDAASAEAIPTDAMTASARAGRHDDLRRLWRAHPLMREPDAAANAQLDAMIADYDARDLLAPGPSLDASTADFARIIAPTLVVTGEHEPAWRHEAARHLLATIPGAERLAVPGAGHSSNLSQPRLYNAALIRFIDAAMTRR